MNIWSLIITVLAFAYCANGYSQTKTAAKKVAKKPKVETKVNTVKKADTKPDVKVASKDSANANIKTDPSIKVNIKVINDSLTQYGDKIWITKNLATSFYSNGDTIPEARSQVEWKRYNKEKRGCWCYYDFNNTPTFVSKYGKLYNFYAVVDPRGLAPKGFHIPTEQEWLDLADRLGGNGIAGKRMKSKEDWLEGGNGDNSSGFNVVPGGRLKAAASPEEMNAYDYDFRDAIPGFNCFFWIYMEKDMNEKEGYPYYVKSFNIFHGGTWVQVLNITYKEEGLSVRYLKD